MRKPLSAKKMVTPKLAKSHENPGKLNFARFSAIWCRTTEIAAIARNPFKPGRYNLLLTIKIYWAKISEWEVIVHKKYDSTPILSSVVTYGHYLDVELINLSAHYLNPKQLYTVWLFISIS